MIYLFSILQLLDLLSTYFALKKGKQEANPLLAYLFNKVGVLQTLIPFKLVVVSGMYYLWQENAPYIQEILLAASALYVIVVVNNINQLRK
jgi:hypothetical protein